MAVFKIFPTKDNFISQGYSTNNYGRDEILEISSEINNIKRILILFPQDEILDIINNIPSNEYSSSLKLYLANSNNLSENYDVFIYPLSQSWVMGTGRSGDEPNPKNGSCWDSPDINNSGSWDYWSAMPNEYKISQSFNYNSSKDINIDIKPIIDGWVTSSIDNNGLLLKFPSLIESSSNNQSISFFSIDTHTIYPPVLEIKWNDVLYSSSLSQITSDFHLVLKNIKKEFQQSEIYKFKIHARDEYPIRNFQTSSLYLDKKILPEESYWSLKDVKTEEIIIDFDLIGTKIGADDNGNYFNINFNGIQPERYYQLIFKIIINGEIIIIDDKSNYFKVIR